MDHQLEDALGPAAAAITDEALMELRKRKEINRDPTRGEIPWTNVMDDGFEEQSSVAHLAGFFLTCQTAAGIKKTMMPSRKNLGFIGWELSLEPMVSRPYDWDKPSPNPGTAAPSNANRPGSSSDP